MQGGEFVVSLLQVEIAGGLGPGGMKKNIGILLLV